MKKIFLLFTFFLTLISLCSCTNNETYTCNTFIVKEDFNKIPLLIKDLDENDEQFYFISDFNKLESIFKENSSLDVNKYYSRKLFDKNKMLLIVRVNDDEVYYDYSNINFKPESDIVSINRKLISKNSNVNKTAEYNETIYLDFIKISNNEIPNNLDLSLNYQWKINDNFVGLGLQISNKIIDKFYLNNESRINDINDIYIKNYLGKYEGYYVVIIGSKSNSQIANDYYKYGYYARVYDYIFRSTSLDDRVICFSLDNDFKYISGIETCHFLSEESIKEINEKYIVAFPNTYKENIYDCYSINVVHDLVIENKFNFFFDYKTLSDYCSSLNIDCSLINQEIFIDNYILGYYKISSNPTYNFYSNFRYDDGIVKMDEYTYESIMTAFQTKVNFIVISKEKFSNQDIETIKNNSTNITFKINDVIIK